jgi:Family of unknown function (DUF6074)
MTRVTTQEQIAAWLNRIHSDSDLPGGDFRIAFALGQAADGTGFIGRGAIAKIARARKTEDDTEPIADVLGRLCASGYLEACGGRRKIDGFRIVARTVKVKPTPKIVPFPAARRSVFIHKHAMLMARFSQAKADAHLRQQLQIQADTMRRKGIAEEVVAGEIRRLESAIKNELWTCILTPEKPA